jgi:hypothetical protein
VNDPSELVHRVATSMTYGGSATAIVSGGIKYFGLSTEEWTLLFAGIGALVAVAGFAVNLVYRHLNYRLLRDRVGPPEKDSS